jgi:Family of unknown function (DUF6365)
MKVLFVTPSEISSGEAITALHMAENIIKSGGEVHFLASRFAAVFLRKTFSERIVEFATDIGQNREIWSRSIEEFRPDVVVFADYPLLFFSSGVAPLASEAWVDSLEDLDATITTLDHLGYAQRPITVHFGPPHLSFQYEKTPALPCRMHILLPCPVQEPSHVPGRKGVPFRYWDLPLGITDSERQAVRRAYLQDENDLLIFHSTPNWAWQFARSFGLPHYSFLTQILEYYLADLPCSATVISVNKGDLLEPSLQAKLRIVNLAVLPTDKYEQLLHSCDLMITDNSVSASLGKAVCSQRPCAVIRNSYSLLELLERAEEPLRKMIMEMERVRLGSIFPYEVFPIWSREDLEELGLLKQNTLSTGFATVELFGGEVTREQLVGLLINEETRGSLRARQLAYVERLETLVDAYAALNQITGSQPHI